MQAKKIKAVQCGNTTMWELAMIRQKILVYVSNKWKSTCVSKNTFFHFKNGDLNLRNSANLIYSCVWGLSGAPPVKIMRTFPPIKRLEIKLIKTGNWI